MLTACGQVDTALAGIQFERGHGSAWGNQLYVEIYPQEIAIVRFFPEGAAQQVTREHIPITAEQWQQLRQAVEQLKLQEKRSSWLDKRFGHSKLDGGEYRNLTLVWQTGKKVVRTDYHWPQTAQADILETLLEQLAASTLNGG